MKQTYNYHDQAPASYAHCFRTDCASAETCLRALAARDLNDRENTVRIVNPRLADPAGKGACSFFHEAKIVQVAYGFMNMLKQIPSGRIGAVRAAIARMSSDRTYYLLRRGDKPISPTKQKEIARILAAYGAPKPVRFDRYEEQINWFTD